MDRKLLGGIGRNFRIESLAGNCLEIEIFGYQNSLAGKAINADGNLRSRPTALVQDLSGLTGLFGYMLLTERPGIGRPK